MSEKKMDPMLRLVAQVSKKFLNVDERLTDLVKENIQAIIKAGLGLKEERWSNREIGLYETNGFKSELHALVETIATRDIKRHAKKIFDEIFADRKYAAEFETSFQRRFEDAYSQALGRELGNLVTEAADKAETDFKEECKSLSKAMDGVLAPIVKSARAKVLAEMAEKRANDQRIGDHDSSF